MEIGNVIDKNTSTDNSTSVKLPFDPLEFPREFRRHYVSANEDDICKMLAKVGLRDLSQLFGHIDPHLLFPHPYRQKKKIIMKLQKSFPNFQPFKS